MITSIVAQILYFNEEQRTVVFTSLEGTGSDAVQGTIFSAVHTDSEQSGGTEGGKDLGRKQEIYCAVAVVWTGKELRSVK